MRFPIASCRSPRLPPTIIKISSVDFSILHEQAEIWEKPDTKARRNGMSGATEHPAAPKGHDAATTTVLANVGATQGGIPGRQGHTAAAKIDNIAHSMPHAPRTLQVCVPLLVTICKIRVFGHEARLEHHNLALRIIAVVH
jgi:hypothetical protein